MIAESSEELNGSCGLGINGHGVAVLSIVVWVGDEKLWQVRSVRHISLEGRDRHREALSMLFWAFPDQNCPPWRMRSDAPTASNDPRIIAPCLGSACSQSSIMPAHTIAGAYTRSTTFCEFCTRVQNSQNGIQPPVLYARTIAIEPISLCRADRIRACTRRECSRDVH